MKKILNKYYPVRKLLFFLGEGLLIFLSVILVLIYLSSWSQYLLFQEEYLVRSVVVTCVFQLALYFFDLYDHSKPIDRWDTFTRMTQSFGIGCIVLAFLYALVPSMTISTLVFMQIYVIISLSLFVWRYLYSLILENKFFSKKVVIVGNGKISSDIISELNANQDSGFNVCAIIGHCEGFHINDEVIMISDMDFTNKEIFDEPSIAVVAFDDRRGAMPVENLLKLKVNGWSVINGISFYEGITGKILIEKVSPSWLIFSDGFNSGRLAFLIKRWCDIILAALLFILSSPVLLITAILIKLESPGHVFYKQERVGEKNKVFSVIKFRSMTQNAEKDGPVWAAKNDSRVTRVGGFIRKVRIDEIPQIWNVLCGQMSFVGPRPERPLFVDQLTQKIPYYSLRHTVKPGITGWAQVCYPYGASEEDALRKLEYDLYYIKNQSLLLDFFIIFSTVKTVLFQKGSR